MSNKNGNSKQQSDTIISEYPVPFVPLDDKLGEEYEKSLIANVVCWPESLDKIDDLAQKHFRSDKLGAAYSAITTAIQQGEDRINALFQLGWTVTQIANLEKYSTNPSLTPTYAKRIVRASAARAIHAALYSRLAEITLDPVSDDPADRLEAIRADLQKIEDGTSAPPEATILSDVLVSLFKEIERGDDVLPTGFADLDKRIRGWPLGTLSLLAGRPGMGKSAVAVNAAVQLAQQGVPVLFVGLEDRKEQHGRRVVSIISGLALEKISHDGIKRDELVAPRLMRCLREIGKLPIYFIDGPLDAKQTAKIATRYIEEFGVRAVFVDHAQEVLAAEEDKRDQRAYEIQATAQRLRDVAVKTNAAVIMCAQINRGAESNSNKRPMLSHLRDSGALEMVARLVLLLYRDEYYDEESEDKGILEVDVAKANHGIAGGMPVRLAWISERCQIADLEMRR